ncbi:unnamed protein product [Cochlearia groenlandica]
MSSITRKTIIFSLFMLFVKTILLGCSSATVYKVGDSDGWTAKDDTYYNWTEHKEFHVGDSLIFEYDPNINDVVQVPGALEYEFCHSPSSPKAVYNTGHDVVTLKEPGFYYFITSNHDQCKSGQKLDILVVQDPSHPIPSPNTEEVDNLPLGKTHIVGDSKGWVVPQESDLYYKWTEKEEFHVGDNLLFQYNNKKVSEDDDVLEISGDLEYLICDPTSPVAVYKTGHDIVKLTKPGVHYYISSKTGHCNAGLKLRVMVKPMPKMSLVDRIKRWFRSFKPHHHHH